jgi:hypothetical protein
LGGASEIVPLPLIPSHIARMLNATV